VRLQWVLTPGPYTILNRFFLVKPGIQLRLQPFRASESMGAQGATALFVPTNNGLPPTRAHAELVAHAKNVDIARAVENRIWVIRADVAGRTAELVSYGSSG